MNCIHAQKISKRVFLNLWDNLSRNDREALAADFSHASDLSKWFYDSVANETNNRLENPNYWMNNPYSFKYPQN